MTTLLQKMAAEILFLNPSDVSPAAAALVELGFEIEHLDWVNSYGPTKWFVAQINTELDENDFIDWMRNLVGPFHGDVVMAGLSSPMEAHLAAANAANERN